MTIESLQKSFDSSRTNSMAQGINLRSIRYPMGFQ